MHRGGSSFSATLDPVDEDAHVTYEDVRYRKCTMHQLQTSEDDIITIHELMSQQAQCAKSGEPVHTK